MNPIIGIVTCGFINHRQFVPQTYIQAIESSGGIPVLIPRVSDDACYCRFTDLCSGFLFCGGDDVTPWLFGEALQTDRGNTDEKTDIFQLHFMKHLLGSPRPILGICRGMQILNIALGGTIYQDIALRPETSIVHMQLSESRGDLSHEITLSPHSMLYDICGDSLFTNTFHHQCLKTLGQGLKIAGITSDGIIESIESMRHPFAVGVQWHPECMYDSSCAMQNLFIEFVKFSSDSKITQRV